LATVTGTGLLLYGAAVEAGSIVVERHTLRLKGWPKRLKGFRIAVLADLHVRGPYTQQFCQRAVAAALNESPDFVVLPGDLVAYWATFIPRLLGDLLEPFLLMEGNVVATPGNHEYDCGSPSLLKPILDELNIRFLRNESWTHAGITWVGVDSATIEADDAIKAMRGVAGPAICVWHEPDMVDHLPPGCQLMISGHSHGGQFRFPGGYTPMHTRLGRKYPRGYYPDAPTPLYVSRGIGTTGPPSRFLCPPEVSILTLVPDWDDHE